MGTPPGCPRLFSPCHGATLVSFLSLSAALLSSPKFASSHSLATKFVGRQIRSLIANRLPLSKKEEHIYSSSALEVKTIFIPSFRNIVKKKGNSPISRLARVEPAPQVQGRDFFAPQRRDLTAAITPQALGVARWRARTTSPMMPCGGGGSRRGTARRLFGAENREVAESKSWRPERLVAGAGRW